MTEINKVIDSENFHDFCRVESADIAELPSVEPVNRRCSRTARDMNRGRIVAHLLQPTCLK